uniref:Uncharacterized protein n=1 Tax=Panagrolaimus sp. PS1159 TaxID=55785 RepID=A0AC35GBF0_9BILA
MVNNFTKAGIGIGGVGLVAVIALSIVTLVKVNDNNNVRERNNTKIFYVNQTVLVPEIQYVNQTIPVPEIVYVNRTEYVPLYFNQTQIVYVNQTEYVPEIIYVNQTEYVPEIVYVNQTEYINQTIYVPVNISQTVYVPEIVYVNQTVYKVEYLNNGTDPEEIVNIPLPSKSNSQQYREAVKYLSDSIDISVSPCDDFYQYACGKYNKSISFEFAELDNRRRKRNFSFDDQGVQWDGNGVLDPWMSADAQKEI